MDLYPRYPIKYQLPFHTFLLLHIPLLRVNLSFHSKGFFDVQFQSFQMHFRTVLPIYKRMRESRKVPHPILPQSL